MDLRSGRIYASKTEARAAGVPESDIAEVYATSPEVATGREVLLAALRECPEVLFTSGPFKGRTCKRTQHGLVRV